MPTAPGLPPRPATPSPRPTRGTTTERGYGHEHQKQRARLLKLFPICQRCESDWSYHLHHLDRDPFNRHDSNAEMICEPCHRAEHGGA